MKKPSHYIQALFCALLLALAAWKRLGSGPTPQVRVVGEERPPRPRATRGGGSRRVDPRPSSGGWRSRLEERWNRRWDERGERGER